MTEKTLPASNAYSTVCINMHKLGEKRLKLIGIQMCATRHDNEPNFRRIFCCHLNCKLRKKNLFSAEEKLPLLNVNHKIEYVSISIRYSHDQYATVKAIVPNTLFILFVCNRKKRRFVFLLFKSMSKCIFSLVISIQKLANFEIEMLISVQ